MTMRECGNVWPVVGVAAAAFLVLFVVPLLIHRQQSQRMATVDAQVSIGDSVSRSDSARNEFAYRWPNSEVHITAERLRDVTACAISAASFVVESSLKGQPPKDTNAILVGVAQRGLIPNEWLTNTPGILQTQHGAIHLRYSPRAFMVELISEPAKRTDGPGILIRIPDTENVSVGSRYFEATRLDGVPYPQPFAPISEIISAGWQPRSYTQSQISASERSQIENWFQTTNRKPSVK